VEDADVLLGTAIVEDAIALCRTLIASEVAGACDRAIEITVKHANEREQFGQPLGANQAYRQRLADAAITVDAMRATTMHAAWRIAEGREAAEEVRVAAWWASDGGSEIVHTTQHLHGGMGADINYPVHRHYLAVKQRANTLGSASSHLAALGALLAAEGER
jgi:alkylation response protein AidB-like acyl-CoA dehydrogenase